MELIPQLKALQEEARITIPTGQSSRELGISYLMAKPFQQDEPHSILVHMAGRQRPSVPGLPGKH